MTLWSPKFAEGFDEWLLLWDYLLWLSIVGHCQRLSFWMCLSFIDQYRNQLLVVNYYWFGHCSSSLLIIICQRRYPFYANINLLVQPILYHTCKIMAFKGASHPGMDLPEMHFCPGMHRGSTRKPHGNDHISAGTSSFRKEQSHCCRWWDLVILSILATMFMLNNDEVNNW